ncbi:type II secretion system protein J [Chloroflexota bacterium]
MRAYIKKIPIIKKDQGGFSLIELLVAIAISGVIIIGLSTMIFQLYIGHARSSGEMTVVRQVQQAGHYISRDTHMAREVFIGNNPNTVEEVGEEELFTLTWYWFLYHPDVPDRDGEGSRVSYTVIDDKLYRKYFFALEDESTGEVNEADYALISKTFIAEYIEEIDSSWNGVELTVNVTASVDGIAGTQWETRTYEAKPRPSVIY